jgi:hypothetical protein
MECYPDVQDLENLVGISWRDLAELEPQLETLLWWARSRGATCRTLADVKQAFRSVQNELAGLFDFVRGQRRHPLWGRPEAYAVAYWKLYDVVSAPVRSTLSGTAARRAG